MKVKDLRIGNLVYGGFEDDEENSNHSVCVVTGLSEDQHLGEGWNFMLENMERKDVENYFEMKPIPLTEEWLLKFGFERRHDQKYYHLKFDRTWVSLDSILVKWYGNALGGIMMLDYVHQLQNIFYAINSEELELK